MTMLAEDELPWNRTDVEVRFRLVKHSRGLCV
jgi:hypothetical protein